MVEDQIRSHRQTKRAAAHRGRKQEGGGRGCVERRAQSRAGGEGRRRGKEREADEGGGRVAAEIADDNFITTRNTRERGAQSEGGGRRVGGGYAGRSMNLASSTKSGIDRSQGG